MNDDVVKGAVAAALLIAIGVAAGRFLVGESDPTPPPSDPVRVYCPCLDGARPYPSLPHLPSGEVGEAN